MKRTLSHADGYRGRGCRAVATMIAAAAGLGLIGLASPASAGTPEVITEIRHVEFAEHYDAAPECGAPFGSTEYLEGLDRLQIVREGDSLHVAWGGTFTILEVSDDPSTPTRERKGTDAATFQVINNGAVEIFHESFHDKNTIYGDIVYYTTFVAVDGEVKVDHFLGRNLPPC